MQIEFAHNIFELPEITQYEDYQYAPECCCPECSRNYNYGEWLKHNTEGIQGYCVQNDGSYCLCLECPTCFTKYRYHYVERWKRTSDNKIVFDIDYWKHQVALAMYLQNKNNNNE